MGYDPFRELEKSAKKNISIESVQDKAITGGAALGGAQKKTNLNSLLGGQGGGMDTSGRDQVVPLVDEHGQPWDYSPEADPNQRTPQQAAKDKQDAIDAQRAAVRTQQSAQITALEAAARGEGPSAAQDQLQIATDDNMRQALAMAASGRGNAALAGQHAGRQRAMMGQQLAAQSGALRAQEMQSAQGQLAQAIQSQRQQDILGDQSAIAREKIASAEKIAGMQVDMSKADPKSDPLGIGLDWGELSQLGVTAAMIYMQFGSDERLKSDIEEVPDDDVDEFYSALKPKSYKYKEPDEPGQSAGYKVGMMAQDVEHTKLGQKLFATREDGMSAYDPQVLSGILLAGMKKLMKGQSHVVA